MKCYDQYKFLLSSSRLVISVSSTRETESCDDAGVIKITTQVRTIVSCLWKSFFFFERTLKNLEDTGCCINSSIVLTEADADCIPWRGVPIPLVDSNELITPLGQATKQNVL
ncbi:hypothetical protein CEXT_459791 [Caerostris extrusa]|uniref:Uncharacterized protein n=1 Tax=Caerostris extrusa TaxID=172846 RepID=A0AAV4UDY1_CAEEX|nr:hypothetical protein CEXT_459791 [Caerostris extrusa]